MGNKKRSQRQRLDPYRAKRSTQSTPEPFGSRTHSRPRLFVVQKHAATRLHYDFRLEWRGTLWSWAVPKGPSPDPGVKRFAVQVEDHPVDYADFEGIIPKGNYGAGAVIVWDKGLWLPLDDPDEIESSGKLHFELRGYKLRGIWLLIRMQGKDWLLRKKPDEWSRTQAEPYSEESVHSGLTLEELREGSQRAQQARSIVRRARLPLTELDIMNMELMLAETAKSAFSSPEWLFELKYDGYRALGKRDEDGEARLRSRNGHDITANFPEVARAIRSLPYDGIVLDGELVVLDQDGKPDFQALQQRARLRRRNDVERATIERPATYFTFDLLAFEGYDLRHLELRQRKELLQLLLPRLGPLRFADHVYEQGEEMFAKVSEMGLEGIMAKKAASPYTGSRSPQWQKIVADRTDDFVVCGFTSPRGSRGGFGALHLGTYEGGELIYAGRVGTGFTENQLDEFRARLEELRQEKPPCKGPVPSSPREHHWVRPEWVVEVRYKQVTHEGLLRAPAFVRLREDKTPQECQRESAALEGSGLELSETPGSGAEQPSVQFSNLDKVFFPEHGYRKGDLIEYYRSVADWMLPYLRNRPLVLTRYPDGIHGKSFYQKNAPEFVPVWLRRVSVWSESSDREIDYFVCDDLESLLYVANLGAIPLHLWPSRVDRIQNPDWCILDLDPKEAPFKDVLKLARAIHALCEQIELPSFVKTTGSSGLHILVPLGGKCTFEQSRMLGHLISRIIEADHPEIATTARHMAGRKGRVYLDYLQNRHGQLLVAPYSVRPLPGAPVSAPLEWSEVHARLTPQKFNIKNLPTRLRRRKTDPMLALLDTKPDLMAALGRLAQLLDEKTAT